MSFDIDDILNEIKQKEQSKSEVTAYLDRYFLDGMIKEYYESIKGSKDSIYTTNLVDITEYNFTGADFRGIAPQDFAIFDFSHCDISSVLLDRSGLEYFIPYIKDKKVTYPNLIVDDANLGPKIYNHPKMGINCKIFLNLGFLDLNGVSFKNCNLMGVIFEGSILNGCNFSGSTNLKAESFIDSMGYENAIFFEDKMLDQQFKQQIAQLTEAKNTAEKNNTDDGFFTKFAYLFDLKSPKRLDNNI
jgi:uncharacterized protein YjbI with pentapeptide repeats